MTTTSPPDDRVPAEPDEDVREAAGVVRTEEAPGAGGDEPGGEPDGTGEEPSRDRVLRPLLWRLHFFGGFLAAPIAVWLAVTGIIYAWNPQIEDMLHGDKYTASADGEARPVSDQVDAAMAAFPDDVVAEVTPAASDGDTTGVVLRPGDADTSGFGHAPGSYTAYVDPYSLEVTGTVDEEERPREWLRRLHSRFRVLDEGAPLGMPRTLTEVAASWVLISLVTGVYLWWPRTRQAMVRSLVPRFSGLRSGRRKPWRDLHSALGMLTLILILGLVVTGLTWSQYAGTRVDSLKETLNTSSPFLGTDLGEDDGDDGGGGAHAGHETGDGEMDLVALDTVHGAAADTDLDTPYTITPGGHGEAWTVQEIDSDWPLRQAQIAVHPGNGEVVDRLHFSDQALLDQASSAGIRFHEGELFGLVNQLLLTVLALGLILLIVSGYMTWWRRRPEGGLGVPPKPGPLLRSTPVPLIILFILTMILLPALGVSFLIFLGLERILWLVRGRGRRDRSDRDGTPAPTPV